MQLKQADDSAGFTLIELTIVLVIIGLIIGGILVGQDMVAAAATHAQITQMQKYNAAVNTFRNKYGGIPGDLICTVASQAGFSLGANSQCKGTQGSRDGNVSLSGRRGNVLVLGGFKRGGHDRRRIYRKRGQLCLGKLGRCDDVYDRA
jgi:prepilin-type N-terminal cleavage/methylation domain-containing protein